MDVWDWNAGTATSDDAWDAVAGEGLDRWATVWGMRRTFNESDDVFRARLLDFLKSRSMPGFLETRSEWEMGFR